jgi:peptidoglycan/LPS O-acetylase OafA/YrhL
MEGGRIPSLDGVRAIAILMVVYGHLSGTIGFPDLLTAGYDNVLGDVAHLGVLVFFVISGFLITSLLMIEREKTGTISAGKFYLRRALRIFPAFYAFMLILSVATSLGWVSLTRSDFTYALTYTVNYYPNPSWQVGHLWSLSIEEQFYLLWPLMLLALPERRALIVAVVAIFLGPLVRAAILEWAFHVNPDTRLADMTIFPAMCDYLAAGCALALLRPWLIKQQWYLRITGSGWLLLAMPVVVLINRQSGYTLVELLFSPVLNVGVALLIEASTRHVHSLAGRLLNWRPLVYIGVLSYSLYLWQQPFLNRHSHAWWNAFPQNIACAFACALLSYFLVERSFLGLRKRMARRHDLPARNLTQMLNEEALPLTPGKEGSNPENETGGSASRTPV